MALSFVAYNSSQLDMSHVDTLFSPKICHLFTPGSLATDACKQGISLIVFAERYDGIQSNWEKQYSKKFRTRAADVVQASIGQICRHTEAWRKPEILVLFIRRRQKKVWEL